MPEAVWDYDGVDPPGQVLRLHESDGEPVLSIRYTDGFDHDESISIPIRHILENGNVEEHDDTELRLMKLTKVPEADLFMSHDELVLSAYTKQERKINHVEETSTNTE